MITIHWFDGEDLQEIPSSAKLPAKGHLIVRVQRGSVQMGGSILEILDPLGMVIHEVEIPTLNKTDIFEVQLPLSTHMMKGKYLIILKRVSKNIIDNKLSKTYTSHSFFLNSRKDPSQIFSLRFSMKFTNMSKAVDSIEIKRAEVPQGLLLQSISNIIPEKPLIIEENSSNLFVNNLWGMHHKTIHWNYVVRPSYLLLDSHVMENDPDEYYILTKKTEFGDEPGLEISFLNLDDFLGFTDIYFPLKVVKAVIQHVNKEMRYVRQKKEHGLRYALKYGKGDCTEYATYVVSLLRKIGILARLVSGYARSFSNNWIPHAFAEVYVYGTWVPLDVMKPTSPYLQIGNRGDLVAISRKNWFIQGESEYELKFMAKKDTKPQISFSHKITETGVAKLPKKQQKKSKLQLTKRAKIARNFNLLSTQGEVKVSHILESTNTVLLVDGDLYQGRIVAMQYTQNQSDAIFERDLDDFNIAIGLDHDGRITQMENNM